MGFIPRYFDVAPRGSPRGKDFLNPKEPQGYSLNQYEVFLIAATSPMTDQPSNDVLIEDHGNYLEARFFGEFTLDRFVQQIALAVKACHEGKVSLLLINATAIQGRPSTVDRYEFASKGASLAHGLKVAAYARLDQIDRFGAVVAQNRGLDVKEFADREKALAWLLGTDA